MLSPARIIVCGYIAVIFAGALLLKTPLALRGAAPVPFLTALFTSASATCVTGLAVVDAARTWSLFGRVVILCLIQIGGLGFMSVTTVFFFVFHKKINLSQRLLLAQSMNLKDLQGVVRLIRHVLAGTLIFEAAGAAALSTCFIPEFGFWDGLGMGAFHSVSAFCNAGIDLMGDKRPFSSLTAYSGDAVVMITVALLVIVGGLGFFVWEDIWRNRRFGTLRLHSKVVLAVTFWLIAVSWLSFCLFEKGNPGTLGGMPWPRAALVGLFQAVTPRSCGFCVLDQASLTGVSKMLTMVLMFIGGSTGSTAGGIKNATAGVLFLSAVSSLRGKKRLSLFGRSVSEQQIVTALSIAVLAASVCLCGAAAIAAIQKDMPFSAILFESVSAVSICGLSQGITPDLAPASIVILIVMIVFGRVGVMATGINAFLNRNVTDKTKRPEAWILMG